MPSKKSDSPLLREIEDDVYFEYKRSQVEMISGSNREGEYHVTDYNKNCMRQVAYQKGAESNGMWLDSKQVATFYTGQLLHAHSEIGNAAHELKMCYNILTDKNIPVTKGKMVLPEGVKFEDVVIGTLDDLYKTKEGEYVIVDKKTHSFDKYEPREPSENYVMQVNIYRLMLLRAKGIDAKYGCIIYADDSSKFEKTKTFAFELQSVEVTQAILLERHKLIEAWLKSGKKTLPPRVRSWACEGYCSAFARCMTEAD